MAGTMTAMSLPVQPSPDMTMNRGMMPSWVGTAMVPMTKARSPLRPGKRSLAKE